MKTSKRALDAIKIMDFLEQSESPIHIRELYNLIEAKTKHERDTVSGILDSFKKQGLVTNPIYAHWLKSNGDDNSEQSLERSTLQKKKVISIELDDTMFKALKQIATREFRTIELQALAYVAHGLRNDLVWSGKGTIKVEEE